MTCNVLARGTNGTHAAREMYRVPGVVAATINNSECLTIFFMDPLSLGGK